MSPDFGGCAMTTHPLRPVIILPKKVTAANWINFVFRIVLFRKVGLMYGHFSCSVSCYNWHGAQSLDRMVINAKCWIEL